jgi:hypothetical protein
MPIAGADANDAPAAASVTALIADGLAKIENVRVLRGAVSLPANEAEFALSGELRKTEQSWELGARLIRTSTKEVVWAAPVAVMIGSGRTHMLLSAAYQQLGRTDEARAAMQKGIELRPGSNLGNVALPPRNASPVFVTPSEWIGRAYLAAGLPER